MKRGMEFIRLLTEFFDGYLPDTKGVSENTIQPCGSFSFS